MAGNNDDEIALKIGIKNSKYEARLSQLLRKQLFNGFENRSLHVHQIIDEIKHLEGLHVRTKTVKENQFKHLPLKGFWKKHFSQPMFLMTNLINISKSNNFINHFDLNTDNTKNVQINYKIIEDRLLEPLLQRMTNGGSLTGEWIIFGKFNNENYYLSLASHIEPDQEIFIRIEQSCKLEYPFLF